MTRSIIGAMMSVALLCCGCGSQSQKKDSGKLDIVVSIPPQKFLVESIGGDYVNVESVMTADANPESFEPTVASMLTIAEADAYIPVGVLDFELPLVAKLRENSPELEIASLLDGITLLYDTHGDCEHHHHHDDGDTHHHHDGDAADPHVWSSVKNMRVMAHNLTKLLIDTDSQHAGYYEARRDSVINRLDSIETSLAERIGASGQTSFLVWHPSLSYLANDYGLRQIVVGSHAKELSVKQLQERINEASASGVNLFFIQQEFDSNQAQTLNEHLNARLVHLNTMSADWENEIKKIADGFAGE